MMADSQSFGMKQQLVCETLNVSSWQSKMFHSALRHSKFQFSVFCKLEVPCWFRLWGSCCEDRVAGSSSVSPTTPQDLILIGLSRSGKTPLAWLASALEVLQRLTEEHLCISMPPLQTRDQLFARETGGCANVFFALRIKLWRLATVLSWKGTSTFCERIIPQENLSQSSQYFATLNHVRQSIDVPSRSNDPILPPPWDLLGLWKSQVLLGPKRLQGGQLPRHPWWRSARAAVWSFSPAAWAWHRDHDAGIVNPQVVPTAVTLTRLHVILRDNTSQFHHRGLRSDTLLYPDSRPSGSRQKWIFVLGASAVPRCADLTGFSAGPSVWRSQSRRSVCMPYVLHVWISDHVS